MSKDELNWEKAINYLNTLIDAYSSIGWCGLFGLGTLTELKRRYENGERTEELYKEIMECA